MTASGKILIVDDNPANAKLMSFVLSSKGFDVRTAGEAVEAMRQIEEFTPRIVLMDLQLPGVDGLELTRRLRADPTKHELWIVAVTAFAMVGDEEKARAAGCDGYVTKPIDTRALPGVVASYLARSRSA